GGAGNTPERTDNSLSVWELGDEPKFIRSYLRYHADAITTLAFNKTGNWLASCGADMRVRITSFENPGHLKPTVLVGHKDPVRGLAFSGDGTLLASGSYGDRVLLWDVVLNPRLGSVLRNSKADDKWNLRCRRTASFSSDSKTLAVAHQQGVRFWHVPD